MTDGSVWLDLSRMISRVGRAAPTGIDRVELAWAHHLLHGPSPAFALCRTTRGFLLLDRTGMERLLALAKGDVPLGGADALSRLIGRGGDPRHRVEGMLRPLAVDRCLPGRLAAMVGRWRPEVYFNVGHSNLTQPSLRALRSMGAAVVVLLHDAIPVTHPHLVPAAQPNRFKAKLAAVAGSASLVVTVSDAAKRDLQSILPSSGPPVTVAPLGVALPDDRRLGEAARSGFVAVGTLEPRKNHALLLSAWEGLEARLGAPDLPQLKIIGQPGFQGAAIKRQIEDHRLYGRSIFLETGAGDAAVAEALTQADALLYPTFAEGFGLPPWEALVRGALPICSDLPVLRDALGPHAIYLDPNDSLAWTETIIQRLSGNLPAKPAKSIAWPRWAEHFENVNAAVATLRNGGRDGLGTGRKGRE
ncbi:MAG: glycosyltransferase family 1 protein [Pseudomonadota bacterium]